MQEIKLFFKHHPIAIILFAALTASACLATVMFLQHSNENKILVKQIAELNAKIGAMTNELGTAKTETELAKKEPNDLKEKLAELTNDNAAFALQAKACNDLKTKLKLK
jgi:septal ring factor EnvC (AmiA/AmiB activator)